MPILDWAAVAAEGAILAAAATYYIGRRQSREMVVTRQDQVRPYVHITRAWAGMHKGQGIIAVRFRNAGPGPAISVRAGLCIREEPLDSRLDTANRSSGGLRKWLWRGATPAGPRRTRDDSLHRINDVRAVVRSTESISRAYEMIVGTASVGQLQSAGDPVTARVRLEYHDLYDRWFATEVDVKGANVRNKELRLVDVGDRHESILGPLAPTDLLFTDDAGCGRLSTCNVRISDKGRLWPLEDPSEAEERVKRGEKLHPLLPGTEPLGPDEHVLGTDEEQAQDSA